MTPGRGDPAAGRGPDLAAGRDRLARALRLTSRAVLLTVSVFWLIFALLSGAEALGGGVQGMLRNSPNALPWLGLLVIVLLSFRRERLGAALIAGFALAAALRFGSTAHPLTLLLIPLPLLLGAAGLAWAAWRAPLLR